MITYRIEIDPDYEKKEEKFRIDVFVNGEFNHSHLDFSSPLEAEQAIVDLIADQNT